MRIRLPPPAPPHGLSLRRTLVRAFYGALVEQLCARSGIASRADSAVIVPLHLPDMVCTPASACGEIHAQMLNAGALAHPLQRHSLHLADAFAGHANEVANLFEGMRASVEQPEV